MRVDWALPCRYAEAAADGTATIVGADDIVVRIDKVPARVAASIALRFAAPVDDFEDEHRLDVRLIDPEAEEWQMPSMALSQIADVRLAHPGLEAGALVAATFEWEARHLGLYTFELYVDDRRQRSLPIVVRDARESDEGT